MTREELLARDTRVHLVYAGVQACPAPADGLTQTSEPMWGTCAACLASYDALRAEVDADLEAEAAARVQRQERGAA